ncbi:MAG: AMP-binding protein [Gaiellaceae bacterium]
MAEPLFPSLLRPPGRVAIEFPHAELTYEQLAAAVAVAAEALAGHRRVALFAEARIETTVGVIAALAAGVTVVPINPKSGSRELEHILGDSQPEALLAARDTELPPELASLSRLVIDSEARGTPVPSPEPAAEHPALILYTSGTTGPPKGAILPRRAIASNVDALAQVWDWTSADVLVHGLPLFHAHGLVLGTLGPIRLGGQLRHLGRFSPEAVEEGLRRGGTMLFAVPTMYSRLATAAEESPGLATALGEARVLVSGSAALPAREHRRIEQICGQRVVERYGLTETLMNCAVGVDGDRRPGYVGPALPGVDVRLVDDDGSSVPDDDSTTIGEVQVRGPNLFAGYLNRADATAETLIDGWFKTGDLATRDPDGYVKLVGRRATDLIKTGGYKVGAGEVEGALLEHPAVAEAAVLGEPDDDLGERIVACVVVQVGTEVAEEQLADHVATLLTPHKRPRRTLFVDELPRNAMGKVVKPALRELL